MSSIPVERYSTAAAAPGAGLAYWNLLAAETFNSLVVDAEDPRAFHGAMVRAPLGELSLMSAHSAAARVSRVNDPSRAARGPRWFDIHFQLAGRSANSQGGREAVLEAGDFTLCDATRPYAVRFTEANHMLCIKAPHAALATRLGDVEALICTAVSGRSGPGAMLSAFLRSLWSQIEGQGDVGSPEAASEVMLDLVGLAYRPLKQARGAPPRPNQWLARARAAIDERICDPDLGVASIAEALGVSPRYLQMLFAQSGVTPSAYITDLRLKLAAERLRLGDGRGVTEVAMAVGFNDLTHFGRVFRRRFGVTPRDYREGVRAPMFPATSRNVESASR
jgi:AraC-like DNA-binding protein